MFFDLARGKIRHSDASKRSNRLEHLNNIKIIGITGTKGKGTTSTLLYKILKACGKNTYLAGNIGKPALELLLKISVDQRNNQRKSASTFVILELSSFQIQDLNQSPDIAVVLDTFPGPFGHS